MSETTGNLESPTEAATWLYEHRHILSASWKPFSHAWSVQIASYKYLWTDDKLVAFAHERGWQKENTNMLGKFDATNRTDADGNPSGGTVIGLGMSIQWQDGPLGTGEGRKEPNGAFVETVLAAALQRLEFYNTSKFRCRENSCAITKIEEALHWLNARTSRRVTEGVEGTHAEDVKPS